MIDDDALRHAERSVRRHLYGTEMSRRETERTQLGRTISWGVVAYRSENRPSTPSPSSDLEGNRTEDTLTDKRTKTKEKKRSGEGGSGEQPKKR